MRLYDLGDIVTVKAYYERSPLVPQEDATMERREACIIGRVVGVSRRSTEGEAMWAVEGEHDICTGIDWKKESRKTFYIIRATLRGRTYLVLPEDMEHARPVAG